ncbi:type II secretion system protein N [Pseudidiomarina woesei]|uniref:Type II secretion system protein N n=1 Tax=Pseudidiomarina woesei TaxID=1381080 RepID=A0A0K6H6G0_9GAMM|nr:type II secretion system protein N [Pseudidiomarina woesei]CUA86488.1 Type II secretion system (T2SS), protein N [Pseudidiomarina woesei]
MMSWRWLLWLIPLYLVALVVMAPARLVFWFVGEGGGPWGGPGSAPLSSVSGTIWQGEASIHATLPTGGTLSLHNVTWQLSPWQLFTGEANVALKIPSSNYIYGEATIMASSSQAKLQANLKGAMQPAIQQLQIPVPITMAGDFELNIANYQVSDFQSGKFCDTLEGTFATSRTEMRLNHQWHQLGDYKTELTCNPQNGINANIDDNNLVGLRLNAQVNGRITAPQVSVNGSIKPTLQTPKPVTDVLVFLGKPDAQGRYNFKW